MRRVTSSQICYSPFQKAFLTLQPDPQLPFNAEEYTDISGKIKQMHTAEECTSPTICCESVRLVRNCHDLSRPMFFKRQPSFDAILSLNFCPGVFDTSSSSSLGTDNYQVWEARVAISRPLRLGPFYLITF